MSGIFPGPGGGGCGGGREGGREGGKGEKGGEGVLANDKGVSCVCLCLCVCVCVCDGFEAGGTSGDREEREGIGSRRASYCSVLVKEPEEKRAGRREATAFFSHNTGHCFIKQAFKESNIGR